MKRLLCTTALLVLTAPVLATTPAPTAPEAAQAAVAAAPTAAAPAATPSTAAQADGEAKVCKLEKELGSNRPKRICRTKAQIEAERAAARDAVSREQR